jgi:hypothetical protein
MVDHSTYSTWQIEIGNEVDPVDIVNYDCKLLEVWSSIKGQTGSFGRGRREQSTDLSLEAQEGSCRARENTLAAETAEEKKGEVLGIIAESPGRREITGKTAEEVVDSLEEKKRRVRRGSRERGSIEYRLAEEEEAVALNEQEAWFHLSTCWVESWCREEISDRRSVSGEV